MRWNERGRDRRGENEEKGGETMRWGCCGYRVHRRNERGRGRRGENEEKEGETMKTMLERRHKHCKR